MPGIGELLLNTLLAYLLNLAAGERSSAIAATRARALSESLADEKTLRNALESLHSIPDAIRAACVDLSRNRASLGVTAEEEPMWRLLNDDLFQADVAEWLQAGGAEEGDAARDRLLKTMEAALVNAGATRDRIELLKTGFFDQVEKSVFASPVLSNWRFQLSLRYLRERMHEFERYAKEAAGEYSPARQRDAIESYCAKALAAWDIVDLTNLPDGDIQLATKRILLRQLYMPLRVEFEPPRGGRAGGELPDFELQRYNRRRREAGRLREGGSARPAARSRRAAIGTHLGPSCRLVVLGDPGGGKTTMLRWLATAYLLRYRGDAAFSALPDTDTLPAQTWIPVLIRCRDLGEADLCRSFIDFLTQHLLKTELLPDEARVMRAVILDRIARGEVLLLVDGLDEISNARVRAQFCQELERTAARYPAAAIVATSRVVGYRDMPHRMGSAFGHGVIAELNRADKDQFARRWVEVTDEGKPADEKRKRANELLDALHSSDRIERLTGNPMLLTTLALVKRKVGRLPTRRNKLYAEAVSLLLNWNPSNYDPIDEDEAFPQLGYLAYEMCSRGVQRLGEVEVLDLLDGIREDYPRIRAVRNREPRDFLRVLEARSSILIKSGGSWQRSTGSEQSVWEFRHLTFQEYLAARAIVDGCYRGRDRDKPLSAQVAPLARAPDGPKHRTADGGASADSGEVQVSESWRETLRLLVSGCRDDDVDDVVMAILRPTPGENRLAASRPRAVLAASCVADEPNISEETAQRVLSSLAGSVDAYDGLTASTTPLDRAAVEVGGSIWFSVLKKEFVDEFRRRPPETGWRVGSVWGIVEATRWRRSAAGPDAFLAAILGRLDSGDPVEAISAALAVTQAAFDEKIEDAPQIVPSLLRLLCEPDAPTRFAAAWALGWLSRGPVGTDPPEPSWAPQQDDVGSLVRAFQTTDAREVYTRRWLAVALGRSKDATAVPALVQHLDDDDGGLRQTIIEALVHSGARHAVPSLLQKLEDGLLEVRLAAVTALGRLGDSRAVQPLLIKLDDEHSNVVVGAIGALELLRDSRAVGPLISRLGDARAAVRAAIVEALGALGDKGAVPPLVARLRDEDSSVRGAAAKSLATLADERAVVPLFTTLHDVDAGVSLAAIDALARLGDERAIPMLLTKLEDRDAATFAAAATALNSLGEPRGASALARLARSDSLGDRQTAVSAYARQMGIDGRRLLSRDLDGASPWLDTREPVTDGHVAEASIQLKMAPDDVRAQFDRFASVLNLTLEWRS
ncbi:MAG TPA: HEAT repeat domain-containing protein [Pirellulales bacterium]|jgi:HEAT repeat protein|nr:HEAT repeat domain-containing protein [Pirellulales bacterium]